MTTLPVKYIICTTCTIISCVPEVGSFLCVRLWVIQNNTEPECIKRQGFSYTMVDLRLRLYIHFMSHMDWKKEITLQNVPDGCTGS